MAGEINFGALRTPDFMGNALRAQSLGQAEAQRAAQQRRDEQQRVSRAATLGRYSAGDAAGARTAALADGDLDLADAIGKMDEAQRAQAKQRADALASVGLSLRQLPYQDRKAQLQAMSGQLGAYGLTPEQIAGFDPTDANIDTQVGLAQGIKGQLDSYDVRSSGDEVFVLRNGRLERRYRGAKTANVADGGSLVEIPGSYGDSPAASGAAPEPGPDVAPTSAPAPDVGATRSVRNNNPGNIEDGDFARSLPGYRGSDGRFAIFDSPEAGQGAQTALLASYGRRGFNNVKAIIERWAPKEDGNDTQGYIDFVARRLGVSPRETLNLQDPAVAQRVAGAIAEFEGGPAAEPYEVAANGATPPPPGGARVIYSRPRAEKPKTRPATAEEKAAYGVSPDVPAQMRPDGTIDLIKTGANQQRVPAKIQAGYADNARSMNQIDNAIAQIEAYPDALGLMRAAGENINQRVDPRGIEARAALANIGSMLIHDRSGAAVTAAEAPRLMPFIPRVTDTPEAAVKKLRALRRELENANAQIDVQFGEESGYGPMAVSPSAASAANDAGRNAGALQRAREAIAKGAPRDAVIQRLRQNGIDPSGL